jgi:hypothetical protein
MHGFGAEVGEALMKVFDLHGARMLSPRRRRWYPLPGEVYCRTA